MLWGAAIGGVFGGLAYWLAHPCDFDSYEFGKAVGIGSVVGMVTSVVAWAVPAGPKFFWGIKATGWLSSGLIGLAAGVPSGALGQMTNNLLTGKPLWENVGVAAAAGGGFGFVFGVASWKIGQWWANWKAAKAAPATPEPVPEGSFSVRDWSGYPNHPEVGKPQGPLTILEGAEYQAARAQANAANAALHRANPSLNGLQIHEVQPVKFGGSPTDLANKVALTPADHSPFTIWWNNLLRALKR